MTVFCYQFKISFSFKAIPAYEHNAMYIERFKKKKKKKDFRWLDGFIYM